MAKTNTKVATIRGTLLKPGVSKNKRLYTAENIRSAAEAANADLKAGKTLNMYTTHDAAAKDDPMSLVGMFTKVWQEDDGSLKFEADVPNTTTGRDYATLTDGKFQRTISIRGGWGATPTIEDFDGQKVLTASSLRLGGADGTASPGVEGAAIEGIDFLESFIESDGNFDPAVFSEITESVEVEIVPFTEEVESTDQDDLIERVLDAVTGVLEADNPREPYGANANYADPGYQADKKKRYPLDSEQHVKAAWSYINVASNAKKYSSAQLARIKGKIKTAAKKYGINIAEWYDELIAGILESLENPLILEMYTSMTISNGDGSVTTNGYANDGADLLKVAHRIALAAIMGMYFIDPDQDGDIDAMDPTATTAPSKPSESTETVQQIECPSCNEQISSFVSACPYCLGSLSQVESADNTEETTNKEKSEMTDTITPAGTAETAPANETAPVVAATESAPAAPAIDYKVLAAEILKAQTEAAEAAQAEADRIAAEEAAKPVTFSTEEVEALVNAAKAEVATEATQKALEDARRTGTIERTGFTTEAAAPYYEAVREGDESQATFLGKLDTGTLAKYIAAVAADDRNVQAFAPRFAANRL